MMEVYSVMCGLCFMLGPFRSDVSLTHIGGSVGRVRWRRRGVV